MRYYCSNFNPAQHSSLRQVPDFMLSLIPIVGHKDNCVVPETKGYTTSWEKVSTNMVTVDLTEAFSTPATSLQACILSCVNNVYWTFDTSQTCHCWNTVGESLCNVLQGEVQTNLGCQSSNTVPKHFGGPVSNIQVPLQDAMNFKWSMQAYSNTQVQSSSDTSTAGYILPTMASYILLHIDNQLHNVKAALQTYTKTPFTFYTKTNLDKGLQINDVLVFGTEATLVVNYVV